MAYSKAYREDVFQQLLEMPEQSRDSAYRTVIGADLGYEELDGIKGRLKACLPGLEDVETYGALWEGGPARDEPLFGMRPDTIQDVFDMMATLQGEPFTGYCTFMPENLKRSRNWCSSYYLKHVFEWLRRLRGVKVDYVSNGELMLGYALFAMYGMGADEGILGSLVRRDGLRPTGLNVDMRMPKVFGIVEGYYARRMQDGRY